MNETNIIERRKYSRYPYHETVIINEKLAVDPVDISEGGLYILTEHSFVLGSTFELSLPFQGAMLKLKATVQHKQERQGIGFMFTDLNDQQKEGLKKLLDGVQKSIESIKAKKLRVLLIDDNIIHRKICMCRLVTEGFLPHEAESGIHALEILNETSYDLILLNMDKNEEGGMDKNEVLAMLKRGMKNKSIPLITYSESPSNKTKSRSIDGGADYHVMFSIMSIGELMKTARRACDAKVRA